MKTCWAPGWKVLVSHHDNPNRKLKYSLELLNNGDSWIGVNTSLPNKLAKEAIENGTIKELQGYENIKPEHKVGKSRIDILLYNGDKKNMSDLCYVEIKNVTMRGEDGKAIFPDAVTERGQKHLKELEQLAGEGHRAVMLYIIQRNDVKGFAPAKDIDPTYAELLNKAAANGLEVLAYECEMTPEGINVQKPMNIELN
jgi:sugar fermentation stimulation protein A